MLSRLDTSTWLEDGADSSAAAASAAAILDDNWYATSSSAAVAAADPFFLPSAGPTLLNSPFDLPPFAFPPSFPSLIGSDFNPSLIGSDLNPLSPPPPPFDAFDAAPRPKLLRPLESSPPLGSPPTLFQKRAARQSNGGCEEKRRSEGLEDFEDGSADGSALNCDSDENGYGNGKGEGDKGGRRKKKGFPAKNLMAERRRRKKLNDRLYMLRSVVPRISKMDRASILGDAIEYLKELLQRINDLHNELESTPTSSTLPTPTATSLHPLTPTLPTLPSRVKEELCASSLPSPNAQQAKVEVRVREGQAVNIHMFCARKPGLLLSAMRALDGLGLDVQQAVISCFNGFALDVFRAEQCKEGAGLQPEEIKAVLLHSAGFQNAL